MNSTLRTLTLSAAALAALTVIAPKASADGPFRHFPRPPSPREVRDMWHERHESLRPEFRGPERREFREREFRGGEWRGRGYGGYGRAYVAPRPAYRYGYAAPYRVFSGFRFYAACPGPGYVYIANSGWVLPPWFGAVWIPGHYDVDGFWVEGFWR
jgi:hypothetical protein